MEEVIREGSWLCPYCQMKNKGANIKCQGCGQARGEVEFFYEEAGDIIEDGDTGPDWICDYCDCSNAFATTSCKQCGGTKAEGKEREVSDVDFSGTKKTVTPPPVSKSSTKAGCSPTMKYIAIGLVILFAIMMFIGSRTYEDIATVTGYHWVRNVTVEKFEPVQKEDWQNEVPMGATQISSNREIRSYRQVQTGTRQVQKSYTESVPNGTKRVKTGVKNLGNGKFKETYENKTVYKKVTKYKTVTEPVYRKDPIYDIRVKYSINTWNKMADRKLTGEDNQPKWPEINEMINTPPQVGNIRIGNRQEDLTVKFMLEKEKTLVELKELDKKKITTEDFHRYQKGTKWKMTVDVNSKPLKIEALGKK
jgi:hypothetical protein